LPKTYRADRVTDREVQCVLEARPRRYAGKAALAPLASHDGVSLACLGAVDLDRQAWHGYSSLQTTRIYVQSLVDSADRAGLDVLNLQRSAGVRGVVVRGATLPTCRNLCGIRLSGLAVVIRRVVHLA
jgi:hypothetical protein